MARRATHPEEARTADERAAEHVERGLADHALERQLQREERGEALSLYQELREIAQSTNVEALRMRRVWACLDRRAAEVTLAEIQRADLAGVWCNAWARGERWRADLEAWLPDPKVRPGKPTATLRRTDSAAPFAYKTGQREGLELSEQKELARRWSAAPADKRGLDPLQVWVRVTPAPDGTFTLELTEALKVFRQFRDSPSRARNRRNGTPDSHPIVEEATPVAGYVPVEPLELGGAA